MKSVELHETLQWPHVADSHHDEAEEVPKEEHTFEVMLGSSSRGCFNATRNVCLFSKLFQLLKLEVLKFRFQL